jgi:hypothetical protein
MKDYYYKFLSEQEAINALPDFNVNGNWKSVTSNYCLYPVGNIYEWDDNDNAILIGWHLNLRMFNGGDVPPAQQYLIQPKTPRVKWA